MDREKRYGSFSLFELNCYIARCNERLYLAQHLDILELLGILIYRSTGRNQYMPCFSRLRFLR